MPKRTHDYIVKWTDKKRLEVLCKIEDYLCKFGTSESIVQNDRAQEDGIEMIADIADIVQPKYVGEDRDH
jgi:hypothetical protein